MLNQSILCGNICKEIEMKVVGDHTLAVFTVACTNGKGERENTVFMDCTAWNKTATMVNDYFEKGKPIIVTGQLKQDNWDDKETGKKRSKIGLTVSRVDFLPGGKSAKPAETPAPAFATGDQDVPF